MANLDRETYAKVIEALEAADGEPRSYSGRCMYDKDCVGVVCGNPAEFLVALCATICENAEDLDEARDLIEQFGSPRTDSMGRSDEILYWPGIAWEDDEDGEDDEGEEPVEVNTEDYRGSHGHAPGGEGQWAFYLGEAGEECPDDFGGKKLFSHNGTYAQAKRAAVEAAREQGKATVFVLS